MEKETILAKLRTTIRFSEAALPWLGRAHEADLWFAAREGVAFFQEFRGTWERGLVEGCDPIIQRYFVEHGLARDHLPRLRVFESYPGSWIIEAAVVMVASVGTTYTILKGLSELPKLADGLTELKSRLQKEFASFANRRGRESLEAASQQTQLDPPPHAPFAVDFVIDARPLASLTPQRLKSHKIHLSVGVSRDAVTLENLGDEPLRNVQLGLFAGSAPRHQWSFADSYMGSVDLLSPHQTISKDFDDFRRSSGESLTVTDHGAVHLDCWIQDVSGIYLFNFLLEQP